jgi:3-methyl-2-oxobutanoate hydroxymethyltransferase
LLNDCGCFGVVLEKIPAALAKKVSQSIQIPTIGIGAGPDADGQVLVMQDMLGITKEFKPRFLRRYADLDSIVTGAVKNKRLPEPGREVLIEFTVYSLPACGGHV